MAAPHNPDVKVLGSRELDGPPFGAITNALGSLADGETLVLLNSFEPEPLYGLLERQGLT